MTKCLLYTHCFAVKFKLISFLATMDKSFMMVILAPSLRIAQIVGCDSEHQLKIILASVKPLPCAQSHLDEKGFPGKSPGPACQANQKRLADGCD